MIRTLVIVALLVSGVAAWSVTGSVAHALDAQNSTASHADDVAAPVLAQEDGGEETGSGADNRVDIQMWTLLAAGGAGALGLIFFVLRVAMGWVQRPTPEEVEAAKHH